MFVCRQWMRFLCVAGLFATMVFDATTARAAETYVDVTAKAGIEFQLVTGKEKGLKHLYESMIGGAGWLDYDGDGWLDLYIVQGHDDVEKAFEPGRQGNRLFRNLEGRRFEDVTERAGVGDKHYGAGLAVGDFDNDGDVDLYVTNYGPNVLYRNNGNGTFTNITAEAGVESPDWSASAAFLDVNDDGQLDLYVTSYLYYDPRKHKACTGNPKKIPGYCHPNKFDGIADRLFLNLGGGRFQDVSKAAGVSVRGRILSKGLGVLPTDFDGDGRMDIFVANDSVPNFLWRNVGGVKFEDAGLESGLALNAQSRSEACMGVDGGDLNGDGLHDYMVINFAEETDTIYLNEGDGFFQDATVRCGLSRSTFLPLGFGLGFVDYDLDGDLDLYIARGHILDNVKQLRPGTKESYAQPDQLLENNGKAHFKDVSATSGGWFRRQHVGRAAAFGDYDNDGDQDIFVVNIDAPAVLLEGRPPSGNHWVGLHCRAVGPSNLDAYGAQLALKVSGREIPVPLEIRTSASYLAANDPRRTVGLGPSGRPEWVRVRWPSGRVELFRDLQIDTYNSIVEGRGTPVSR